MEYEESRMVSTTQIDHHVLPARDLVMAYAGEVIDTVMRLREHSGSPKGRYIITASFQLDDSGGTDDWTRTPEPSLKESSR